MIKEGFIKCYAAAILLRKCKRVIKLSNKSLPVLYDIRKYQEELDLPKHALLQEMATRWWSILAMLENLRKNIEPVELALQKGDKVKMILSQQEQNHVKEIITLLRKFKFVGEQLDKENDVTISQIIPWFNHLNDEVLKHNVSDSSLIQSMKHI